MDALEYTVIRSSRDSGPHVIFVFSDLLSFPSFIFFFTWPQKGLIVVVCFMYLSQRPTTKYEQQSFPFLSRVPAVSGRFSFPFLLLRLPSDRLAKAYANPSRRAIVRIS